MNNTNDHSGRETSVPQLLHQPSVSASTGAAAQFDPWILWVTFRRCWAWALPVGAVLAGLAAFFVLRNFVPVYRASSLLEANQDYVVFQGVMPVVKNLAQTEKALFLNSIVLGPVLADADLRRAPSLSDPEIAEQNLRKNLSISGGGTASRLVVSYQDSDREAAATVCNAIVQSYLRQRDAFDSTRVNNLERWLEPEIQRWEQEVAERRRVVQKLSEQTLGYAPGNKTSILENQGAIALLTRLRSQIAELTVELSVRDAQSAMQSNLMLAESDGASEVLQVAAEALVPDPVLQPRRKQPSESEIEQLVDRDPKVAEAKTRISRYKSIMINMEDSDLVRVRREYYEENRAKMKDWEQRLQEAKLAARDPAIEKLNRLADEELARRTAQAEFDRRLAEVQRQAEAEQGEINRKLSRDQLVTKIAVLREQYDEELTRMEQFGGTSAELQFAQEELAVSNSVLMKLRDRVAAIRTERRQDGAVRTLTLATPPSSPVTALPVKHMGMAASAAMMVPFLFGLLWELRMRRITDSSMCGELSVIGEIARLPSGTRSYKGRRIFEESIDSLRANLFLSTRWKDTRSIAVVSSISGEGKSSVASQLSLSIAKATGQTVLLVDADLRCPDQHRLFGLEMGPGFSAVLAGKASLLDAVNSRLGNLIHLLPAGQLTASPHRLMSPERLQEFMREALSHYSYVVIDTAPVLSAGETLAVASTMEATLLCVMRDVSRLDSIHQTTRRLEAAGASVIGTVFSGVTSRQYVYRYGDYQYALSGGDIHDDEFSDDNVSLGKGG